MPCGENEERESVHKMQTLKQRGLTGKRNSSIELLKIFGIFLIVINHVIQTLHEPNSNFVNNDYILNLDMATTNIQQLILSILRYSGSMGNMIFFICSAWFLLDNDKTNKKKLLQILMDVWVASVIILVVVYILRGGNLGMKMIIKQLLPTTFENNWYITCYLLFYPLHTFLNWVIHRMDQKTLLRTTLVLSVLYVFANYVYSGAFFATKLILWTTVYFLMAYMKYYLVDFSNNMKANILMLVFGLVGNIALVCLTNFFGVRFGIFRGSLLKWNSFSSPFLILAAISMLNIARNVHFQNRAVNYISGLSLLIYIFHENMLLRIFYRPLMWDYVYNHFGYEYILLWMVVLVAIVFGFGLIASILYKHTVQKLVALVCNRLYPILQKIYGKIEKVLLGLH